MTLIRFPWPNLKLSSNSRTDRRFLTADRQQARATGYWITKDAGLRFPAGSLLELTIVISPPDRRHRDDDNILTAFKSYRDGIFKALELDDSAVRRTVIEWYTPRTKSGIHTPEKGGALYVNLKEYQEKENYHDEIDKRQVGET